MRSACGFFAGCMLARGRSAPRRLPRAFGGSRFARRGSVPATAREAPSDRDIKSAVASLDHRFYPLLSIFCEAEQPTYSYVQVPSGLHGAISSGVQQGEGVQQRPWQQFARLSLRGCVV